MLITRPQNLSIEEIATANKVPRAHHLFEAMGGEGKSYNRTQNTTVL